MPAQIVPYLRGLLQGTNITATFLAYQFGCSHDGMTRFLTDGFAWKAILMRLILRWFGVLHGGYLIIDDTVLAKPYGKKFAEACFAYSSCLDKVVYGYHVVLLAWTNGMVTIPLSFRFYRKKEKSKIALARELLEEAQTVWHLHPYAVLFDSWYAAGPLLDQIQSYGWIFFSQLKKNRVISMASLADDLSVDGDALTGPATGYCMVLVIKHDGKFFATNNRLASHERILQTYRLRWKIEEVFRFLKDRLHLQECQARSKTAQETHLVSCIIAYLIVQRDKQEHPEKTLYQIQTDWLLNRRLGNNRINHYVVKELLLV